jgi:sensor histidine kinase YesM
MIMNKKIISLLIHVPVWIVAFLVSYFFGTEKFPGGTNTYYLWHTLTLLVWFLGSFYTFYSFLVPEYLEKGRTTLFGIYAGLLVLIVMPLLVVFSVILFKLSPDSLSDIFSHQFLLRWLLLAVLTLFCSMLGLLYRFSIDWFNNLHLKKDLENVKLQTELVALKSRLNPHFLFNTLNNIDTLIQASPEKASVAISKLSDLLRYVVYETADEKIPIQKELDTVKKYMDLERLRILNPDSVSFKNSITNEFLVPPMIFMPFIENAFKHSNLNNPNQKISVSFSESNNALLFHCVNTIGVQKNESKEKGIGLELVRKRLNLTFPGKYSLNIEQQNNEYIVLLKISFADD